VTKASEILARWLSLLESVCVENDEQVKPEVATHSQLSSV
jgi:hypothetical protein